MDLLREYVGGPKNRYREDKFNLDLTYITPRVIAMAFPGEGFEKLYRNSIDEVKQLLEKNHGTNYMIINLSNKEVNEKKLKNVQSFVWEDHQAPHIELISILCEKATEFLL
jgi:phosphatidylinositol-3,4,5-trisphosphate 3-phosphatase/dual-specificity protein phosphatase PTEN